MAVGTCVLLLVPLGINRASPIFFVNHLRVICLMSTKGVSERHSGMTLPQRNRGYLFRSAPGAKPPSCPHHVRSILDEVVGLDGAGALHY